MITYLAICDNCGATHSLDKCPADIVAPKEFKKRIKEQESWHMSGKYIICHGCWNELSMYRKDTAEWLKDARAEREGRLPRTPWWQRRLKQVYGADQVPHDYGKAQEQMDGQVELAMPEVK